MRVLPYSIKCMRNKIYVYVFAIQSMLCTDYELFDMFNNEIQFFGCKNVFCLNLFSQNNVYHHNEFV